MWKGGVHKNEGIVYSICAYDVTTYTFPVVRVTGELLKMKTKIINKINMCRCVLV